MSDDNLEAAMRTAYYDTSNGFSEKRIYRQLKSTHPTLTHKLLNTFINKQESKQLFAKNKASSDYHLSIPKSPFARCQMDLLDLSNEVVNRNRGMKWLFVLIDSYTKLAFVRPMKTKSTIHCLSAFMEINEEIWREHNELLLNIDCDNESAFTSKEFSRYCEKNDIILNFSRNNDSKSKAFVERFNRTIREKINTVKSALNTNNWVDHIQQIIKAYNNTEHSSTKREPIEALTENSYLDKQIENRGQRKSSGVLRIGDDVRILKHRTAFEKGTDQRWSKSLHKIERIESGNKYYVNDRVHHYKDYELLPVSQVETRPDTSEDVTVEVESNKNKKDRKIKRVLNKESVEPHNEVKDSNARILRSYRSQRTFSQPMVLI